MLIRKITSSDAAAFVKFFDRLLKQTDFMLPSPAEAAIPKEKQAKIIESLGDSRQVFIAFAPVTKDIVGFIGVTRLSMEKNKHVANFAIGVLKDFHRQGLATELLTAAQEWLKERGVRRLELTVIKENTAAVKLYEKLGFRNEGVREKSIFMHGKYYDEFYMAKEISS